MGDGGTVMAVLEQVLGILVVWSNCRAGLISGNKSLKLGIYQSLLGQGARPALHQGAHLLQRLLNTPPSAPPASEPGSSHKHCLVVFSPPRLHKQRLVTD